MAVAITWAEIVRSSGGPMMHLDPPVGGHGPADRDRACVRQTVCLVMYRTEASETIFVLCDVGWHVQTQ